MTNENKEQQEPIEEPKDQKTPETDPGLESTAGEGSSADVEQSASKRKEDRRQSKRFPWKSAGKAPEGTDDDATVEAAEELGTVEKVIAINRITKVTKGGKKLSFSALVVVGDTKGNVGYCLAKAAEVSIAIRKAMAIAKKNMVKIPMKGTTIPHEIIGRCSGSRVLLKPASDGTGVIASGPVRAVCDGAGIHNILTKCHRSNNPINVVKATMDGLTRLKTDGIS